MIRLKVSEIAHAVNGRVVGDGDLEVEAGVEIDSRLIKPGFLFVAKPGEQTDGHNFAGAAIDAGASALLVERELDVSVPQVIVADVVVALGLIATEVLRRLREASKLTVIGITGSNGKTSTKNMLRAALSQFGETIAPRESFNNHVGAPLSMLLTNEDTRYLVVELGADGLGSIDYLANMCKPDVAVELKVGLAHVGEFGGIEVTAKIKAEPSIDRIAVKAGAVRSTPVGLQETALHIALEHSVNDACNCVGPVNCGSAVAQNFDPANAARCNFVGVGADNGY